MNGSNFNQLRKSGPLAAHHASTENSLLKVVWPYPNYSPDFLNTDQEIAEWGPWLDTCAIALNLYPQLLSHKLQDLIDYFDLGHRLDVLTSQHCPSNRRHYHCALYDANRISRAAYTCWKPFWLRKGDAFLAS